MGSIYHVFKYILSAIVNVVARWLHRVQAVPHWYYIIVGCEWCGLKVKYDMVSATERSAEARHGATKGVGLGTNFLYHAHKYSLD